MDDQQTYLLNGLLARQFALGRIVRFRPVNRGSQPQSFELFTAQEKEYLVQLYPPAYDATHLDFIAHAVNLLDDNRFSVMPYLRSKAGTFAAEGPQSTHMLVSLAPAGSALEPAHYTDHDLSQIGLRLAWMHRLLSQQVSPPPTPRNIFQDLRDKNIQLPQLLTGLIPLTHPAGWVHGDIQPAALLHDADHQLRAVTDWALLHWGCPLEDLVDAFVHIVYAPGAAGDRGRGAALLEAYDSLTPIKRTAWTPVVVRWCAQRLLETDRRPIPENFREKFLEAPERLATAIASCL